MRRIFVLSILFGIMAAVEFLKVQGTVSGHITLAAIGFVVLAAFTMSELGSKTLKLPKVTGYIIAGIFLGPQLTNILSLEAVTELRMFNTLALGLIALNAGLELSVKSIAAIAKTLASTISAKLILLPIFVGGSLYLAGKYAPTWAGIDLAHSELLALCLIFSAIAIGTSPAISIAISSELKSKGKLTDLVLGNAIFKDLVVVICLAIAIAVAKTLINPAATLGSEVILYVAKELGLSIALGLVCGFIIIAYTRFIGFQMLLFVIVLILAAAEISILLHTELLLVFIAAGFVVRNFSEYEHDVLDPLEKIALPTFIVFFTIAGASIDLINSLKVLPLALLLFLTRGLSYYIAAKVGGKIGKEPQEIIKYAWLGYLPQAGVTLGLIAIASSQLLDLGPTISTLGMTVVALNLLIGPITLRFALKKAGDVPDGLKTPDLPPTSEIAPNIVSPAPEEPKNITAIDIADAINKVSDQNLRQILSRADIEVHKNFRTHIQKPFQTWLSDLLKSFEAIAVANQSNFRFIEEIQDWARQRREQPRPVLLDSIVAFRNSLNKIIETLHYTELAPFEDRHFKINKGDGLKTRLAKIWLKTLRIFSKNRQRKVPVKALMKMRLLDALSTWSNEAVKSVSYSETNIYDVIKNFTEGKSEKKQILPEASIIGDSLIESLEKDFTKFLARAYELISVQLNDAGSPDLPNSKIRVSEIEPRLEDLNGIFDNVLDHATDVRTLSLSSLALSSAQRIINLKLNHLINESVVKKISETTKEYEAIISDVRSRVDSVKAIASALTEKPSSTSLIELSNTIDSTVDQKLTNRIDRLAADLSYELSVHKLAIQLKKIAYSGGGLFVIREQAADASPEKVQRIKKIEVDLQSILDECLVDDLIPEIEASVQAYRDFASGIKTVTEQIAKILSFSLENDSASLPETSVIKSTTLEGVESADTYLTDYVAELKTVTGQVTDHIQQNYSQVLEKIEELTYSRSLSRSARERFIDIQERIELLLARYRHYKPVGVFLDLVRYSKEFPDDIKNGLKQLKQRVHHEMASDAKFSDKDMLKGLSKKLMPPVEASTLPPLFKKGFSLTPVKDRRFFIANNDALKDILDTELDWMAGQNTGGRLIVGESGSGKTSIINICQLELKTERVYRTDPTRIPVRGSLLQWFARNVNTSTSLDAIERGLRKEKSVVLVDNLEQWISPTPQGIGELKSILELMSRTSRSVFWIVTVTREFYQFYGNVLGLDLPFGRSINIGKLSTAQIRDIIANRLAYSGIKVSYKQTMAGSWLHRIRLGNDEDIYYRVLGKFSHGNIRAALALWICSINFNVDKSATPSIANLLNTRFPYKDYLPNDYQTILLNLLRHGPMRERELSLNLQWGHERIFKILHKLSVSGQIYRTDEFTNQYDIYEGLKVHISQALQQSK